MFETKILEHNLTKRELFYLEEALIINGCGGKGSFSFDKVLRDHLKYIPGFDETKRNSLFLKFRKICHEHDIDFRFKRGFYRSNFRMAKKVYKLLRLSKVKWIKKRDAFKIALIIFIVLSKYGKSFYNTKQKHHDNTHKKNK